MMHSSRPTDLRREGSPSSNGAAHRNVGEAAAWGESQPIAAGGGTPNPHEPNPNERNAHEHNPHERNPHEHNPHEPNPHGPDTRSTESGMLRSARLRWTAHWTERSTEAEIRILESHVRLAEQRKRVAEAELESRRRVAQAARFAEDEEAERQLRNRLRGLEPDEARQLIEKEMEIGAMLLEREVLRFQRQTVPFGGGLDSSPKLLPGRVGSSFGNSFGNSFVNSFGGSVGGSLEVHVTDEQIEALALQALARLGQMDAHDADEAWEEWRTELIRRLPAYAAAEVIRRAERLRTLAR